MCARRQPAVGIVAVGVGLRRAAGMFPRRSADVAAVLRRGACLVGVCDRELVRPQRRGIVDPRQAVADVPGIVQRLVARSQDPRGLAAGAVPAIDTLEDLRLAARIVIAVLAKHRCRRAPDGLLLLLRRDLALVAVLRASPVRPRRAARVDVSDFLRHAAEGVVVQARRQHRPGGRQGIHRSILWGLIDKTNIQMIKLFEIILKLVKR